MRMIGLGLLAFIIASAAYLLSYMDIWQKSLRQVSEMMYGPQLVFETTVSDPEISGKDDIRILRSSPDETVVLSGLPAYQSVTFQLPIDARPTSGYLQIDATFQVLSGVEGALRVSINNARRAEVLLHSGEAGHSFQIVLTSEDLAGDKLVVSLSLQGRGPNMPCGSEGGIEAIVEIEATSGLFLSLDRPITTARDHVRSRGNNFYIGWPEDQSDEEKLDALVSAAHFIRDGQNVAFRDANEPRILTPEALSELQTLLPKTSAQSTVQWPLSVADKGPNRGLRRFTHSTSWRVRYDMENVKDSVLPDSLDLHLFLGPITMDASWMVTVTLNERMVYSGIVSGSGENFNQSIHLPENFHKRTNIIEVVAVSSLTPEGICNDGPELIAEMLGETQIEGGGGYFSTELGQLRSLIGGIGEAEFSFGEIYSAPDIGEVAHIIASIVPENVKLDTAPRDLKITAWSRAQMIANAGQNSVSGWIVYQPSEMDELVAEKWPIAPEKIDAAVGVFVELPTQLVDVK